MLAAKAVVIGAVAFVTAAIAAVVALPLGEHFLNANGNYVFPASALTEVRIIVGSSALLAGHRHRVRSPSARSCAKAPVPSPRASSCSSCPTSSDSSCRAALRSGCSESPRPPASPSSESLPHSALVSYPYTLGNGYYPLAPWAGALVLCAYALLALGVAAYVLRRRDA